MIVNRQSRVSVPLRELDKFLARARRRLRLPKDSLTVCLVTDAEIARWNRAYRGKSGPTDVLSFPSNARKTKGRLATEMHECEKTTFLTPLLQITRRNISAISPSLRLWRNETRAASAAASTTRCAFLFFTVSSI